MCTPFHYISPSYLQGLLQHLRTNELEKNFHNLFLSSLIHDSSENIGHYQYICTLDIAGYHGF